MRGRPLCAAAVFFLAVQLLLVGGLKAAKGFSPSAMEQRLGDGDEVTLCGQVYRREEKNGYAVYYVRKNQVLSYDGGTQEESQSEEPGEVQGQIDDLKHSGFMETSGILVYVRQNHPEEENAIQVGNVIQVKGGVSFFEEPTNPGCFNQKFYYQKQDVCAMIWAEEVEVRDPQVFMLREKLTRFRMAWKRLLTDSMGEYYGNSMSAILLGDKNGLDEGVRELYQKSGIGHILAISGLHMTFIGMGVYKMLRKLGLPFYVAGGIGILFLGCYTLMTGCGISSLRALIMFAVCVGADIAGREYDICTAAALAAIVIVAWRPLYVIDAGFLLSFGAILAITLGIPVLKEQTLLPQAVCASAAVQILLLPVQLYFYFEIPSWCVFLNLLVVPLMSAVLGAGILGSLICIAWADGGRMVLLCCKGILWLYERLCEFTMELPFGRLVLGRPAMAAIVAYYAVLFGAIWWFSVRRKAEAQGEAAWGKAEAQSEAEAQGEGRVMYGRRGLHTVLVLVMAVLFCLVCRVRHQNPWEIQVTMLDVGQGDCFYVQSPDGMCYLVDGGSTSESGIGKYRLEPFLKSRAVSSLDYVFVTHGDEDHISGIEEMLANQSLGIRIRTLVLPPEQVLDAALTELARLAAENGTRVVTMQAGEQIVGGGSVEKRGGDGKAVSLTCLAPDETYDGETGNEASLVLHLQYGNFDMLFTGDIGKEGEERLLEADVLKECDVLKAAHHGSKNSSCAEFLEAVSPQIVLISAGEDNTYGHPHPEAVERLSSAGGEIYCTIQNGAVTVSSDGETMRCGKAK